MTKAKPKTITGTITKLNRLTNTRNGNPRYEVFIDQGDGFPVVLVTSSDSSIASALNNGEYQSEAHEFTLSRKGLIDGLAA